MGHEPTSFTREPFPQRDESGKPEGVGTGCGTWTAAITQGGHGVSLHLHPTHEILLDHPTVPLTALLSRLGRGLRCGGNLQQLECECHVMYGGSL